MDTSKEYIKMCEKAVEIQELRETIIGNNYFVKAIKATLVVGMGYPKTNVGLTIFDFPLEKISEYIWLPRQDQLQGMIGDFKKQKDFMVLFFRPFYYCLELGQIIPKAERVSTYWSDFKSWEQLWLAFVMKEKFNKVWDGEDWNES